MIKYLSMIRKILRVSFKRKLEALMMSILEWTFPLKMAMNNRFRKRYFISLDSASEIIASNVINTRVGKMVLCNIAWDRDRHPRRHPAHVFASALALTGRVWFQGPLLEMRRIPTGFMKGRCVSEDATCIIDRGSARKKVRTPAFVRRTDILVMVRAFMVLEIEANTSIAKQYGMKLLDIDDNPRWKKLRRDLLLHRD